MGWGQKAVTKSAPAVTHLQLWSPKLRGFKADRSGAQQADADLVYSLAQSEMHMCACMHTCTYMGICAWVYMSVSENHPEGKPRREWRSQWAVGMRVGSRGTGDSRLLANDFSPRKANSMFSDICNVRIVFSGLFWSNSQNMFHKINSTKWTGLTRETETYPRKDNQASKPVKYKTIFYFFEDFCSHMNFKSLCVYVFVDL